MREILFRLWYKSISNELISKVYDWQGLINGDMFQDFSDDPLSKWTELDFKDQYTGKKDAGHKKVFENDIVECLLRSGQKIIAAIKYDENMLRFNAVNADWSCPLTFCEFIQVLGNTHENTIGDFQ